jgi:hypothetical protein
MPYPKDIKQKFDDLKDALSISNRTNLHRKANGGNTILFIYPPHEEPYYLDMVKQSYKNECIIDVAAELISYLDFLTMPVFEELFEEYGPNSHQIFKSKSRSSDLFARLIDKIIEAAKNNKTPILIRTGALYGTGIDNHMFMEDKSVRELELPLVVFYPATMNDKTLMFLNCKPSPGYRSQVIS